MHAVRMAAVALMMVQAVGGCARPDQSVATSTGVVRVVVTGLASDHGTVRMGLYNNGDAYAHGVNAFRHAAVPIAGRTCEWLMPDVPYGEYAITLYHDANGNATLDRNALGIPVESYGVSNNAKPALGMPPYSAAKFVVASDAVTQTIRVR